MFIEKLLRATFPVSTFSLAGEGGPVLQSWEEADAPRALVERGDPAAEALGTAEERPRTWRGGAIRDERAAQETMLTGGQRCL